jgi:hypothetical protein
MVSALLSGGSDAAVWQAGEKTEEGVRLPGIGHKSVVALREIGLLETIRESERGLLRDGGTAVAPDTDYTILRLKDAWFHHHRQEAEHPPASIADMDKEARRVARQTLAERAATDYRDLSLNIKEENGKTYAYTAAGERVGRVSPETAVQVQDGQTVTLRYALGRGGDLEAVVVRDGGENRRTQEEVGNGQE